MKAMRKTVVLVAGTALALSVAACGAGKKDNNKDTGGASGSGSGTGGGGTITIGTADSVVSLDPAGSYDNGSTMLETQVYQYLMAFPNKPGAAQPDAAKSCDFTQPTEYTCTLKDGLKFSNGDPLTAKDVEFSFQRVVKIADPNGPSSLLSGMASVKATDDKTVVFTLKNANDQTWPFILGTSAGPIVDSKVFPPDKLLSDEKAVGSGPYKLGSYSKNELVELVKNPNYGGDADIKNDKIVLKYYKTPQTLRGDVESGAIDIAWRGLTTTDIDSLKKNSAVKVQSGAGGELRYVVFNFKTMPGGTDEQKRAVRRAVAYSVDRAALSDVVYKGTYQPSYSMIPPGVDGATEAFKDEFGDSPDKSKAADELSKAGVQTPVSLNIQYALGHYGPSSDQEYNEVKRQLESTGLFKVSLQSAEWDTYTKERVKDTYPIYQLGWFPDFPDADNYLSPFLVEDNFVHSHYCDPGAQNRPCDTDGMEPLLKTEATTSGSGRTDALKQIQTKLASGELPYLPLLVGQQVAVTRPNISGVDQTLDPSFLFRMWMFSKS